MYNYSNQCGIYLFTPFSNHKQDILMDIKKFKEQHVQILSGINDLRKLTHDGIEENAAAIASGVSRLSSIITQHLAVEDRILYPALENSQNTHLANLSKKFRVEMAGIANPFIAFARKWQQTRQIMDNPEGFRSEANVVLKRVYERMRQEDRDFYPVIESSTI